jgi:hypothetical protein
VAVSREELIISMCTGFVGSYFMIRSRRAGYEAAKSAERLVDDRGGEPPEIYAKMARWSFVLLGGLLVLHALYVVLSALIGHLAE